MRAPDTLLGTAAVRRVLDEDTRMITAEMSGWNTVLINSS